MDVKGVAVDERTGCAHYRSSRDVIAIKMACCEEFYACKDCHEAVAGHAIVVWPRSAWDTRAVLCGVCGTELTIREYMECGDECPHCRAALNPGCRNHHHFYFETSVPA